MRIRPAPVVAMAALVALAGCREGQQSQQAALQFMGSEPSCQEPATRPMTRPFQQITVQGTTVVVRPDTVVQPPAAGIVGWISPRHSWRITYANQESPTDSVVYTGRPGELVWAGVRPDAECRYYKYDLEVWGPGFPDTLEVDPGDLVQPYSYSPEG